MPKAFEHVDKGLTEHLHRTVMDGEKPFLERVVAGLTLVGARGLLDQINNQNEQLPQEALPAPKAQLPEGK